MFEIDITTKMSSSITTEFKQSVPGSVPTSFDNSLDDREEAPTDSMGQWLWLDELNVPSVLYMAAKSETADESVEEGGRKKYCCSSMRSFAHAMRAMESKTSKNRLRTLCMRHPQLSNALSFSSSAEHSNATREHNQCGKEGRGDRRLKLYVYLLLETLISSSENSGNNLETNASGNNHTNNSAAPPTETHPSPLLDSLWHAIQSIHSQLEAVVQADDAASSSPSEDIPLGESEERDAYQPALIEVAALLEASRPTDNSHGNLHSAEIVGGHNDEGPNATRTTGEKINAHVASEFTFTKVLHRRYPRLTAWIEEQWSMFGRLSMFQQTNTGACTTASGSYLHHEGAARFQCRLAWRVLALTIHTARLEWNRSMGNPMLSPLRMSDMETLRLLLLLVPLLQHRVLFRSAVSSPSILLSLWKRGQPSDRGNDDHSKKLGENEKDIFKMQSLYDTEDNSIHREQGTRQLMRLLLQYFDPELSFHLESHRVDVSMYMHQWIRNWFVEEIDCTQFREASNGIHTTVVSPQSNHNNPTKEEPHTFPPTNQEPLTATARDRASVLIARNRHLSALLPLVDYIIILEKRCLLPYVAISLLLSHRIAFLQMGEEINKDECSGDCSPSSTSNTTGAKEKTLRGASDVLDKVMRALPMTTLYHLSSPNRFAELSSASEHTNPHSLSQLSFPLLSGTSSSFVHAATADPQLASLGSVPLSALPLPFPPPPTAVTAVENMEASHAGHSKPSNGAVVPLPWARIVFQNAQLLYNATPVSAQRALQSLLMIVPAVVGNDDTVPPMRHVVVGDPPAPDHPLVPKNVALPLGMEDAANYHGETDHTRIAERTILESKSSVYEDPSRALRQASFYAKYYLSLPVLPVEDCDILMSFGTTTNAGPAPTTHRLPLRILDCRSLKSFEYARLPDSIFVGDLVSLDDRHLTQLISRATARRGEHLVLFGAGRAARVPARSPTSGEEEAKTLMLLSLRLVQNARLPFVSLCVEGLEGLRRLIYHRRLPLQRGPVPQTMPKNRGDHERETRRLGEPSGAAMTKLAETSTAVLGSMRHLFTFASTDTTAMAAREKTNPGRTAVRASDQVTAEPPRRSRPPIIPSHSPSSPPPPSAVASAVAETAAELRERSGRGIATLGEWGRGALGKLKEVTTSAAVAPPYETRDSASVSPTPLTAASDVENESATRAGMTSAGERTSSAPAPPLDTAPPTPAPLKTDGRPADLGITAVGTELASAASEKVNVAATAVAAAATSVITFFGRGTGSSAHTGANPSQNSEVLRLGGVWGTVEQQQQQEEEDGGLSPYFSVGEPLQTMPVPDRVESEKVEKHKKTREFVDPPPDPRNASSLPSSPPAPSFPSGLTTTTMPMAGLPATTTAPTSAPVSTGATTGPAYDNDPELEALGLITSLAPIRTTAPTALTAEPSLPLLQEDSIDAMFDEMFGSDDIPPDMQVFSAGKEAETTKGARPQPYNATTPNVISWPSPAAAVSLTNVEEDDLFADLDI